MSRAEVNAAPRNEPNVELRLLMDMNRANSVPSIPGGQSCPERIRNGIILPNENTVVRNRNFYMHKDQLVALITKKILLRRCVGKMSDH
jgi:hypothetical protein